MQCQKILLCLILIQFVRQSIIISPLWINCEFLIFNLLIWWSKCMTSGFLCTIISSSVCSLPSFLPFSKFPQGRPPEVFPWAFFFRPETVGRKGKTGRWSIPWRQHPATSQQRSQCKKTSQRNSEASWKWVRKMEMAFIGWREILGG